MDIHISIYMERIYTYIEIYIYRDIYRYIYQPTDVHTTNVSTMRKKDQDMTFTGLRCCQDYCKRIVYARRPRENTMLA